MIEALADELASPEQIEKYAKVYITFRIDGHAHKNRRRAEIEARIAAIAKYNERLLDMLMSGIGVQSAMTQG